jgi:hypothetical protein
VKPGTGKTNFLISFFEQVLNCRVIVVKTADGLRHATFFKGKSYAIIFDDLDWKNENMTRENMLHLLSGETTTNSNIKHSSVLIPKETYRKRHIELLLRITLYMIHSSFKVKSDKQKVLLLVLIEG